MNDRLEEVLGDPETVAQHLQTLIPEPGFVTTKRSKSGDVTFSVELHPWHTLRGADPAFPVESVLIKVRHDGAISTFPSDPQRRSWLHRDAVDGEPTRLCLFYDEDPDGIRWTWDDGLACYLGIVHRHLIFEEWVRRGHPWPCEDAPHGRGDHPVRSLRMQAAAGLPISLDPGAAR